MNRLVGAALDLLCVVVFVAIGRASHSEAASASGFFHTLWPFAVGALLGWLGSSAWRRPAAIHWTGVAVWLCTVGGGMTLRAVSGQEVDATFLVVAAFFLGLFLLGWRVAFGVAPWLRRTVAR